MTTAIVVPTEGRQTAELTSDDLVGTDGNAFAVLGTVRAKLRRAGASPEYVAEYLRQASAGDYDHLLAVSMAFLDAEPGGAE